MRNMLRAGIVAKINGRVTGPTIALATKVSCHSKARTI